MLPKELLLMFGSELRSGMRPKKKNSKMLVILNFYIHIMWIKVLICFLIMLIVLCVIWIGVMPLKWLSLQKLWVYLKWTYFYMASLNHIQPIGWKPKKYLLWSRLHIYFKWNYFNKIYQVYSTIRRLVLYCKRSSY